VVGQKLGHYEILGKIGEGGMGVVWKARDTRLNRIVAIKVLPPDKLSNADRKRRFIQEAQAASALNHPNIITIHDIALQNGCAFQVMEYVNGKTLDQLIPINGMPEAEVLPLAFQMVDALAAAHATGIIHRDLKPGNVIVSDSGRVKLLDFGLAKLAAWGTSDSDATKTISITPQTEQGTVIGTVCYMSPEQAEGRHVDGRADIFSFGALLYEMLSGRRAFDGDSPLAMLTSVLRDDPPALQKLVPAVSAEISGVVEKCLQKDPAKRFQSVTDILRYFDTRSPVTPVRSVAPEAVRDSRVCIVAVLPFVSMSPEIECQCFGDGLAEEISYRLSRVSGIQVLSRTSAALTKGENATRVLEGSVRKSGTRVRVHVQLFDPADGCQLWSERYDEQVNELLEAQDDLASRIVSEMIGRLIARPAFSGVFPGVHHGGSLLGE
jgi:serine/threonine protein kinase